MRLIIYNTNQTGLMQKHTKRKHSKQNKRKTYKGGFDWVSKKQSRRKEDKEPKDKEKEPKNTKESRKKNKNV